MSFSRPLGWIRNYPDPRDIILPVGSVQGGAHPAEFCHYAEFPQAFQAATEDQLGTNGCVGNAVGTHVEEEYQRDHDQFLNLSRMFIYHKARKKRGWHRKDMGSIIGDAFEACTKYGVSLESYFRYLESLVLSDPDSVAVQQAARHKMRGWVTVPRNDMKCIISGGGQLEEAKSVVVGVMVWNDIWFGAEAMKTGYIGLPTNAMLRKGPDGGHAICLTGYKVSEEWYEFPNSWGQNWAYSSITGRPGWGRIHAGYILNPRLSEDFQTSTGLRRAA